MRQAGYRSNVCVGSWARCAACASAARGSLLSCSVRTPWPDASIVERFNALCKPPGVRKTPAFPSRADRKRKAESFASSVGLCYYGIKVVLFLASALWCLLSCFPFRYVIVAFVAEHAAATAATMLTMVLVLLPTLVMHQAPRLLGFLAIRRKGSR